MNPNASTANLDAIEDEIIVLTADTLGSRVEQGNIFGKGSRKGVMRRLPSMNRSRFIGLGRRKQRKLFDPQEARFGLDRRLVRRRGRAERLVGRLTKLAGPRRPGLTKIDKKE